MTPMFEFFTATEFSARTTRSTLLLSAVLAFAIALTGCDFIEPVEPVDDSIDQPEMHDLSIRVVPRQAGSVSSPGGTYEAGAVVDLVAEPAEGWYFKEWLGDTESSEPSATLALDGDKRIFAVFGLRDPTCGSLAGQSDYYCVSIRYSDNSTCQGGECAMDVLDTILSEGISANFTSGSSMGSDSPPHCVGHRSDLEANEEGAQQLADLLGAGYRLDSRLEPGQHCHWDGFPYSVILP